MPDPWIIPKIWPDSTVFIIGGGPSINSTNLDLIKNERTISVNNAYGDPVINDQGETERYEPRDWVDVAWFGDCGWYDMHKEDLFKFPGLKVSCCPRFLKSKGPVWVKVVKRGKMEGIEKSRDRVAWNKNSGGSAVNLAIHFGAKKIVLLGFDMQRVNGKKNYHNDHVEVKGKKDPFSRYIRTFEAIAREADRMNVEILNATPKSALTYFPIKTLEEVVGIEKYDSSSVRKAEMPTCVV